MSEEVLTVVFATMQRWTSLKGFPVRTDDRIYRVYGIGESEDLDDLLLDMSPRCRREFRRSPDWEPTKMTVRDLVHALEEFPFDR